MKTKLEVAKSLFESEAFKPALTKSLELLNEALAANESEIVKETYILLTHIWTELIVIKKPNDETLVEDWLQESAANAASCIDNEEELFSFFDAVGTRVNKRFVQLLSVFDSAIDFTFDIKNIYVYFFMIYYGDIHSRLKAILSNRRYALGAKNEKFSDSAYKHENHYEEYIHHRESKLYERGVACYKEYLSLMPDFPVFHPSDIKRLGVLYHFGCYCIMESIPKKEKEKERYPSVFLPRMKNYINFHIDYLNSFCVENGNALSLSSTKENREKSYEELAEMETRIQKYEPEYRHPEVDLEGHNVQDSSNDANSTSQKSGGCYVATAIYGSYDCPEVWTLRRYRDYTLAETWYGRTFIKTYYAISPTLVKLFGHTEWFKNMWKGKLDRMVAKLQANGVESTPYEDKKW